MAGSFGHVVNDKGEYIGTNRLDTMGDMAEAIEEMAFVLLCIQHHWTLVPPVFFRQYHECMRGERPWPEWWKKEDPD